MPGTPYQSSAIVTASNFGAGYLPLTGGTLSGTLTYNVWNGIIEQINDSDGIVPQLRVGGAFSNAPYDSRSNQVFRMGWNLNNGGGPYISGETAIGIEMEDYYNPGSGPQMEFHIPFVTTSGVPYRIFSAFAKRDASYIGSSFSADKIVFYRREDNADVVQFNLSSTINSASFSEGFSLVGLNSSSAQTWSISSQTGIADFSGSVTIGTSGVTSALAVIGLSTQGPYLLACSNEGGAVFGVSPNGALVITQDVNFGNSTAIFGTGQSTRIQPGAVLLENVGLVAFSGTAHAYDAADTSMSRSSAGVLAVGKGAQGDTSGTVQAATYQHGASGPTWTSGAGAPSGAPAGGNGSMFSRTDGGAGSTCYVWNGSSWTAVA
jgi:hypothetical protein